MGKKLLTLLFVSVLAFPLSTAVFAQARRPQKRAAGRVLSQEAIRTNLR